MKETQAAVCAIIPAYQEEARVGSVVEAVKKQRVDVVVVDDGSTDRTAEVAEEAGAHVIRQGRNQGKGIALEAGFKYATEKGYEAVMTLDADGQHDPAEIPLFLKAFKETVAKVIIGNRMGHADGMPFVRLCTNRFMSWLLSREMGQIVPDTQSGYRLYAVDVLPLVSAESGRFAAESEVLLNLAKAGVVMGAVPIRVIYRDERSKIKPLSDTIRFFSMLRRVRAERKGKT